jgi:hypothetical protein
MDRSHYLVRRSSLSEQGRDADYDALTPEQRLAMVRPLTLQAWMFKTGRLDEPRLRRDVARLVRRSG